ncbi:MAG TPA: FRG domain-containing protein [Pyrinomonadaceae bacterium]|nr:FRG domain-containing protein [Pyrinomonadaceae bacterium]
MRVLPNSFRSIESAIAELGSTDSIWFRGHAQQHQLVPALYRFPGGAANELNILNRYRSDLEVRTSGQGLSNLIALHHSYVPTRLLAWTESLYVALFCAIVRESHPAVFILNPVALNAQSKIEGIVKLNSQPPAHCEILDWPDHSWLPERPVAIDGRSTEYETGETESIFTLHGTNELPLEKQCPDCVRKVVLTKEERSLAGELILAGNGWRGFAPEVR